MRYRDDEDFIDLAGPPRVRRPCSTLLRCASAAT